MSASPGPAVSTLRLPGSFQIRIERAAIDAFPNEICGFLLGDIESSTATVQDIIPAANVAENPAQAFEIDPAILFALQKRLRNESASGLRLLGCYHSHPNGKSMPSQADRDRARDWPGSIWLIAAMPQSGGPTRFAAFSFSPDCPLNLAIIAA